MKFATVGCSLNPNSRSDLLVKAAADLLEAKGEQVDRINLARIELPFCDGASCYSDPNVVEVKHRLMEADGILLGVPIYNYDINAAAKNLVELTGRDVWTDKVVGFLCAAGGKGSYMSVMGIANSLMLDFHTMILPRFLYATGGDFEGERIADPEVEQRLERIVSDLVKFAAVLAE